MADLSIRDLFFLVGLPAISDLIGTVSASGSARRAADTQVAATERAAELNRQTGTEALELYRRIYNDQVRRAEPYRQGGLGAFSRLLEWSGLPVPAPSAQPTEIPPLSSTAMGRNVPGSTWMPAQEGSGRPWIPGAVNTAGTLASLALLGKGGGAAGQVGQLARFAKHPIAIAAVGTGLGVGAWLKSQAHWEANDAVKTFENPFHLQFLAPLNQALATGQIQPEEAIRELDANWQLYQESIRKWAGNSSDKKKVAEQSISNPKLVGTIQGIRQNALNMANAVPNPTTNASAQMSQGSAIDLNQIAARYRRQGVS